jgi:hypothetical protein
MLLFAPTNKKDRSPRGAVLVACARWRQTTAGTSSSPRGEPRIGMVMRMIFVVAIVAIVAICRFQNLASRHIIADVYWMLPAQLPTLIGPHLSYGRLPALRGTVLPRWGHLRAMG